MQDFFDALTGPNGRVLGMVCVFFLGCCLAAVIAFVESRKIEVRRMEAAIKLEMLRQGMSAQEIVQVMRAGQGRCTRSSPNQALSTTTNAAPIC